MVKSTCYKCQVEIQLDDEDEFAVHPMCEKCQASFDNWFASQLG